MNDETTRLINEAPIQKDAPAQKENSTPKEEPLAQNQTYTDHQPVSTNRKSSKKGQSAAAAAGGFVTGAAVGAASTAFAGNSSAEPEIVSDDTDAKDDAGLEAKDDAEANAEDIVIVPEPEQAILANDEGIRYAHVDADNFSEAFAQARAQVGAGGVFEYDGKLYGTYTAEEWNGMSAQERADYQNRVNEVAPSHHAAPSYAHPETHVAHNSGVHSAHSPEAHMAHNDAVAPEPVAHNAEMIDAEPADNEIRVLGVEAVSDGEGNIMNVALVENSGDQALLVDVDNNGSIDVLLHDDNYDGRLQEKEVHDISGAGIEVADLMQVQSAQEGDLLYTATDDMPDYVSDADSIMSV